MYCPKCGFQMSLEALYCPRCGMSVGQIAEQIKKQDATDPPTVATRPAQPPPPPPQLPQPVSPRPPRLEFRDEVIPLGHKVKAGWYAGGVMALEDHSIESQINQRITQTVQALARQGWEPEGSYSFRDLCASGSLSYRKAKNALGMEISNTYHIDAIRVRFRRYDT